MNENGGSTPLFPVDCVSHMYPVPGDPGAEIAVITVPAALTENEATGVVPKATPFKPVKPVPLIWTVVPPSVGPSEGFTLEIFTVTEATRLANKSKKKLVGM